MNIYYRNLGDQWSEGSSNYAYSKFINVQNFVDNALMEAISEREGSNPWSSANNTILGMTKGYFGICCMLPAAPSSAITCALSIHFECFDISVQHFPWEPTRQTLFGRHCRDFSYFSY